MSNVPKPRDSELPRPTNPWELGGDSPLLRVKISVLCPPLDLTGMWVEPAGRQKGRLVAKQVWWVHGSLGMSLALSQNRPTIDIKHLGRDRETANTAFRDTVLQNS